MEKLLTVREVARQLRTHETTITQWIKSGALAAITLPSSGRYRQYRIKQSTLDTVLKAGAR